VAEQGVVIQEHFAIHGQELALIGDDQGVDLGQRSVAFDKGHVEPLGDLDKVANQFFGQSDGVSQVPPLEFLQPEKGFDGDLGDALGGGAGDLFDFDAAFGGGHHHRPTPGPVNDDAEIDLLGNVGGLVQQDFFDGEPFDLHAQDLGGHLLRLIGIVGYPDASRLAAAPYQDLRFDDHARTEAGGDRASLFGGGGHIAAGNRRAVLGEDSLRLIFVQFQLYLLRLRPETTRSQKQR